MAIKPLQKEIKGPSGTKYTLQNPGARIKTRIIDNSSDKNNKFLLEKLNEQLFANVIVDPKVSWDYFEQTAEGQQDYDMVIAEAQNFLMGPSAKE